MPVPKGIIVIVKRAQRVNTNKPIIAYECLIYKEKSPCTYACRSPCSIYWRSKKKKGFSVSKAGKTNPFL